MLISVWYNLFCKRKFILQCFFGAEINNLIVCFFWKCKSTVDWTKILLAGMVLSIFFQYWCYMLHPFILALLLIEWTADTGEGRIQENLGLEQTSNLSYLIIIDVNIKTIEFFLNQGPILSQNFSPCWKRHTFVNLKHGINGCWLEEKEKFFLLVTILLHDRIGSQ